MTRKYWITILLSGVIALLYSLPWLAFFDQPRAASPRLADTVLGSRVFYLFTTVFITSAIFFYTNFFFEKMVDRRRRILRIGMQLLAQAIIVVTCTCVLLVIASLLFDIRAVRAYFVFYLIRNIVLAAVVWLLAYIVQLMEKLEKEKIEVLLLETRNAESELSALRSQIDPHFIFNTLSTLGSLIPADNRQATVFLEHMSDTFRYVMEKRSNRLVSLKEELGFLRSYLYMMNCRFGDSIRLSISVDENKNQMLPQFALQIAVENAIKHNILSPDQPLVIKIIEADDRLNVTNTLQRNSAATGYGIGLTNLSKRYQLLGDGDIEVHLTGSLYELSLPLIIRK